MVEVNSCDVVIRSGAEAKVTVEGILTAISMVTFCLMIPFRLLCMSFPTEDSENYLNARMSFLISLILSSYVGVSLNRRQDIRNLLGKLWGALETLAIFQLMLLPAGE